MLGVNLGEVGFLNVVSPEEAPETVRRVTERFRRGETEFQELPQIRATGDGWSLPPALNEVAILGPQRGQNDGVGVEIRVDGELYSGTHADGALVSTPTAGPESGSPRRRTSGSPGSTRSPHRRPAAGVFRRARQTGLTVARPGTPRFAPLFEDGSRCSPPPSLPRVSSLAWPARPARPFGDALLRSASPVPIP